MDVVVLSFYDKLEDGDKLYTNIYIYIYKSKITMYNLMLIMSTYDMILEKAQWKQVEGAPLSPFKLHLKLDQWKFTLSSCVRPCVTATLASLGPLLLG